MAPGLEAAQDRLMIYRDRREAGRHLARALLPRAPDGPLVLALPRGGVPVAFEVARALETELDIVVARKLGAPRQPELGIGAIAPGGVRVLDTGLVLELGITPEDVARIEASEENEIRRRTRAYRGDAPPPGLRDRVVLLVDDGLATGATMRAAVRWARAQGAREVVVAVPVGPPSTVEALRAEADDVVCLSMPPDFRAVGRWYDRFDQTSDEEVVELLQQARAALERRAEAQGELPARP